jgi:hypothetical protein
MDTVLDLADEVDTLNFETEKSIRYHRRRRSHYERINKLVVFATIMLGASAFADASKLLIGFSHPEIWGLVIAALGTLDLVFEFKTRACTHSELARQFADLAIELRTERSPSTAQVDKWQRRKLEIEIGEPPIFWLLERDCLNEVAIAWGRPISKAGPLTWSERRRMNWVHADAADERRSRIVDAEV